MRPVFLRGCGFFTPGLPSVRARAEGKPVEGALEPACEGVPVKLLRGTSLVTRVALDVLVQAARDGGADLRTAALVFGSELGEVQTAIALLEQIRTEGVPSPMRFKNSVHNAASGTASIAFANTGFATSIAAGGDLVAMCILEAWALLEANGGDALVALAEEPIPAPLPRADAYPAVGFGFHLSANEAANSQAVRLEALRLDPEVPPADGAHALAPAHGLLDAFTLRRAGVLSLSRDASSPWCVSLSTG